LKLGFENEPGTLPVLDASSGSCHYGVMPGDVQLFGGRIACYCLLLRPHDQRVVVDTASDS
jgi:hypothetical protein